MISSFALRLADRSDAAPIARLSRDLIEYGLGWSWTVRRVLKSIADPDTNAIVAVGERGFAGFGIMKYGDEEAHLLLLAVAANAQRSGVGAALVGWLEAVALTAGIGQVMLEARVGNAAARGFYRALGYHEVQRQPGYYQGREACVRLAKDLWE